MNRFCKIFFTLALALIIVTAVISCEDNKKEFESTSYMTPNITSRTTAESNGLKDMGVNAETQWGELIPGTPLPKR